MAWAGQGGIKIQMPPTHTQKHLKVPRQLLLVDASALPASRSEPAHTVAPSPAPLASP